MDNKEEEKVYLCINSTFLQSFQLFSLTRFIEAKPLTKTIQLVIIQSSRNSINERSMYLRIHRIYHSVLQELNHDKLIQRHEIFLVGLIHHLTEITFIYSTCTNISICNHISLIPWLTRSWLMSARKRLCFLYKSSLRGSCQYCACTKLKSNDNQFAWLVNVQMCFWNHKMICWEAKRSHARTVFELNQCRLLSLTSCESSHRYESFHQGIVEDQTLLWFPKKEEERITKKAY